MIRAPRDLQSPLTCHSPFFFFFGSNSEATVQIIHTMHYMCMCVCGLCTSADPKKEKKKKVKHMYGR